MPVILCAVDKAETAQRVVDTARWLADAWRARLVVMHAVGKADRDVDELAASIGDRLGGADANVRFVEGPPIATIMEAAERERPELLVVGSRGHGPLRSAVLGSVSRELASRARCPVVVVPSGERWTRPADGAEDTKASVVCGVDGSEQALAASTLAGRTATQLGCRLVVVHARQNLRAAVSYRGAHPATPPLSGQEDAVRLRAAEVIERAEVAAGVSAVGVVEPGPPAEVLESVANREGARLIVIAARGLGGLGTALLGSVAAQLSTSAARPVMVLSEAAARAMT